MAGSRPSPPMATPGSYALSFEEAAVATRLALEAADPDTTVMVGVVQT